MNIEKLKNAGIDYDGGVKRFVGRAHLYEKSLLKFTKDATFPRVKETYAAGDKDGLAAAAHELKGMCGNIGLSSLYTRADALVMLLRGDGYSAGELELAYASLETEYGKILNAVLSAAEEI